MSKQSVGQSAGRALAPNTADNLGGCEESAPSVGNVLARMSEIIGDRNAAYDLISLVFDQPRHWPTVSANEQLSPGDAGRAITAAERLATGMPIQYAANKAVFRHLTLHVDERVLIPRPETEVLVDIVLDATRRVAGGLVVDVGTGSGAIALALATEGKFDRVIGTDISGDALAVARMNGQRIAPAVDFRRGAILSAVPERGVRAVVSNPPYIAFEEAESLPPLVRDWEPSVALFAGNSGNAVATAIIHDAADALLPDGLLAMEVDMRRAGEIAEYAAAQGAYQDIRVVLDLAGRERFVVATRRTTGEGR